MLKYVCLVGTQCGFGKPRNFNVARARQIGGENKFLLFGQHRIL